ncbi:dienelactone hydrolase family protein [Acidovorax sp. GBBC 3334]|uniref:alpha/beta hydrolase n=1 Tax=Acidovorax sp. GBBC 3334 TaxID=2940496 RepID=UPI002303905C|nr:dienelactone hydrolase family protein [Acidovorax sp. GBBC 3334]MDA8455316.1 dienelactone hydrolase family protein [Acidovorax sp. GBBC 3334]
MLDLDLPLTFLNRPAAPETQQPWLLVLMHGVGSHEKDLFALAPYVPAPFHVVSLRAPYPMGPGANTWFEFSVEPDGSRTIHEAQEIASRSLLARTVETAAAQLGVPPDRVIVGGFSQGGIMALSLLLTRPDLLRGAMVWHSRLLPQVLPHAVAPAALSGKALWVSHGEQDNVIPLASARAIRDHARGLPLALTYREYPGMHEIRPNELHDAMEWLAALDLPEAVVAR